jgi:hypothetical protein
MMPVARGVMYAKGGMTPVAARVSPLEMRMMYAARGRRHAGVVVMQTEVQETQTAGGVMQFVMEMPPAERGMSPLAA